MKQSAKKILFITLMVGVWLWGGVARPLAAQTMTPSWQQIAGHPLTLYVTQDGRFELRSNSSAAVASTGFTTGVLYLGYDGCVVTPATWGTGEGDAAVWQPVSQTRVQGRGLTVDPWRVLTQVQAWCGTAAEGQLIVVQSVASYAEGDEFVRLSLNVCGGRAGETVTTGLLTQTNPTQTPSLEAQSTAVLDSRGCATFSILWQNNALPQAPLALEMFTSSATAGRDMVSWWGFRLVFAGVVALTGLWLWLLRPKRSSKQLVSSR